MNKELFINTANEYGKQGIAFLMIANYELNKFFIKPLTEIDNTKILYSVNGISNFSKKAQAPEKYTFEKLPISFAEFEKSFNHVVEKLNKGYSYLTNLTCETPVKTNLLLKDIFFSANAKYRLLFNDEFVVFSPEIFIQIKNGNIYSFPMKGTIDASIPDADRIILDNEKEKAEHATIVDLLRNDLSCVATNVRVDKYRYIDVLKTNEGELLQISSQISGKLPHNYKENIGDIIIKMLPAGSISGAPKPATLEIIDEAETHNRNYYTGIVGVFDGNNFDSGVMIRYIEKRNGQLYFKSGGGITSQSNAADEYNEMIRKVYLPF